MDRGTWIALAGFFFCLAGLLVIAQIESGPPTPSPASTGTISTPASTQPATQNNVPQTADNTQDCQSIANAAAQNDQATQNETTSVVQVYFNQASQQCYYEVDIFTSTGNETDIRTAPNDQTIASCTTTPTNTLSCQKQGGVVITEPQFKALLANDIPN
jgi:maltose-binding protein MalE